MGYILGLSRDNGKENGNDHNGVYYWGYIGIVEKKMATTGIIRIIQGLFA